MNKQIILLIAGCIACTLFVLSIVLAVLYLIQKPQCENDGENELTEVCTKSDDTFRFLTGTDKSDDCEKGKYFYDGECHDVSKSSKEASDAQSTSATSSNGTSSNGTSSNGTSSNGTSSNETSSTSGNSDGDTNDIGVSTDSPTYYVLGNGVCRSTQSNIYPAWDWSSSESDAIEKCKKDNCLGYWKHDNGRFQIFCKNKSDPCTKAGNGGSDILTVMSDQGSNPCMKKRK